MQGVRRRPEGNVLRLEGRGIVVERLQGIGHLRKCAEHRLTIEGRRLVIMVSSYCSLGSRLGVQLLEQRESRVACERCCSAVARCTESSIIASASPWRTF